MTTSVLHCGRKRLDLSRVATMGVLNVTPDSFSDGGALLHNGVVDLGRVREAAERMVDEGAAILDVGGESTRPRAEPPTCQQEHDRVLPVVRALRDLPTILSVDTSEPSVMRAAIAEGAVMINDVRALRRPGAIDVVAASGAAVCLMHMQGEPSTMQAAPHYDDPVADVLSFLQQRVSACVAAGIGAERLLVDPGFGFGKSLEHNRLLLMGLSAMTALAPVLVGLSRKSMIGKWSGESDPRNRVHGSVAAAVLAVLNGARVVRVHDVAATVAALRVIEAVSMSAPAYAGGQRERV